MNTTTSTTQAKALSDAQKQRLLKTIGYYVTFIALGMVSASLGPTLPGLAEHTKTNLDQISILFTARSLGYLIGSSVGGHLYDRVAGNPIMVAAIFTIFVMMVIVPIVPVLWLLAVVLMIIGAAEGALDVGGNALLVWVHKGNVASFMNGLHFFFGLGAFISPIIIAQAVLATGDITWAYWGLAILVLPAAIWMLPLSSPTPQKATESSQQGKSNRLILMLSVCFFFLYVAAEVGFGGWIYTYAVTLDLASEASAAYLTSAFWGSLTLGRLFSIPIATRIRPRNILLADLLGCLTSVLIILQWPGSLKAVWIGTLGLGMAMASIFPTTISLVERRMTLTGKVTSWFLIGASGGAMFLPWLIGQLFDTVGPQVTMVAILFDLIVALVVYALLISRSDRPIIHTN